MKAQHILPMSENNISSVQARLPIDTSGYTKQTDLNQGSLGVRVKSDKKQWAAMVLKQVADAPVNVRAVLARTAMPMRTVAKLKVGDIVKLTPLAGNTRGVEVEVAGRVKFAGISGTSSGQMAVQINRRIAEDAA